MNKTPFLSGFPRTLFGRKTTSAQQQILNRKRVLCERSPGQLSAQLSKCIPPEVLARQSTTIRQRVFTSEVTFWGFLSQVLSRDGSCALALANIQAWLSDHGLPVPSTNTAGYCTARSKLPDALLNAVHEHLCGGLCTKTSSNELWHGHVVKAVDGTSTQLPDTKENQALYPQHSSQKPGCGFPLMKIAALLNLCHGGLERFVTADNNTSDARMMDGLLPFLGHGEVLLADRAYGSYELFSLLQAQGAFMVCRLHQGRKTDWRMGKRLGDNDRLVKWRKPVQQSRGSGLTGEQWAALPDELSIRMIRYKVKGRDGVMKTIYLSTSLLDPRLYPAGEIGGLYFQRWQIELSFRDIKTTMGMEKLRTCTPSMVAKELQMFIIAYNAIRWQMLAAARTNGVELWTLSFKGARDVMSSWSAMFRHMHQRPHLLSQHHAVMLGQISRCVLDDRPGRHEPRAVKRRPKPFQLLTAPRSVFKEIPHRDKFYRNADKVA